MSREAAIAIMALGFFGAIIVTMRTIGGIIKARIEARAGQRPALLDEGRLERLEAAVDAIAIEVERIAEAQRYSLKLEEERRKLPSA